MIIYIYKSAVILFKMTFRFRRKARMHSSHLILTPKKLPRNLPKMKNLRIHQKMRKRNPQKLNRKTIRRKKSLPKLFLLVRMKNRQMIRFQIFSNHLTRKSQIKIQMVPISSQINQKRSQKKRQMMLLKIQETMTTMKLLQNSSKKI